MFIERLSQMSVIEDITYCDLIGTSAYSQETMNIVDFLNNIFKGFTYYCLTTSKDYVVDYEYNILTCSTTIFLNRIWYGFKSVEIRAVIAWYMIKYHHAYFSRIDSSFAI